MNSFTISRVFSAPRSLVFDCWVNPSRFEKWGLLPAGWTPSLRHADVRPGGYYLMEQHGPDGAHLFAKYVFRQVSPIDRLVFVISICSEEGEIVCNAMVHSWPRSLLTTVAFEDTEQGTRVSVEWEPLDATDDETEFFMKNLQIGQAGWTQTFDRLSVLLEEQVTLGKQ